MLTILLYAYLLASLLIMALALPALVRVIRGAPVGGAIGPAAPRWVPVVIFCFGCLGVLSSAPSIFSENPHWLVDKPFHAVSRIIETVTLQ